MCVYKDESNGVCNIKCKPCNNCKTRLNVNTSNSFKWRAPDRWDKYLNPMDNLMYAVLLRAALDCNGYTDPESHRKISGRDAIAWLETTGAEYREYLNEYGMRYEKYEQKKTTDSYTKEH